MNEVTKPGLGLNTSFDDVASGDGGTPVSHRSQENNIIQDQVEVRSTDLRCHENFFGYVDNQFEGIIAPKMRENSEVNMQSSATAALFEEDGVQNPRPESAYKIFAPKQLITTELGEEEKQQVHHAYNK